MHDSNLKKAVKRFLAGNLRSRYSRFAHGTWPDYDSVRIKHATSSPLLGMAGTRSSLHTTHHHIPHPTPPSSGNTHFTSSSGIIGITGSSGITSSAGSSSGSDSSGNYRRDKFSCEREVSSLASSSSVTSSPSSALHQSSSSYSESSMSEEDVPTAEECAVFVVC